MILHDLAVFFSWPIFGPRVTEVVRLLLDARASANAKCTGGPAVLCSFVVHAQHGPICNLSWPCFHQCPMLYNALGFANLTGTAKDIVCQRLTSTILTLAFLLDYRYRCLMFDDVFRAKQATCTLQGLLWVTMNSLRRRQGQRMANRRWRW